MFEHTKPTTSSPKSSRDVSASSEAISLSGGKKLPVTEGFVLYHSEITGASSVILSEPSGSMPCVASSAITRVNLPTVGGQPTQMYQLLQWACTKHSVHGRTELYRTTWTVAHGVLFHRRQGLLLDYSGIKELLSDSSLSHLD